MCGGIRVGPHLKELHGYAALSKLQRALASRETSAYYDDGIKRHGWLLIVGCLTHHFDRLPSLREGLPW